MYRFENDNCLIVYSSEVLGLFTFKVREIREDLWEWEITCGNKVSKPTMLGDVTFPMKGTAPTRFEALAQAAVLKYVDPDIVPSEMHDGAMGCSTIYGWVAEGEPCVLYGLSPTTVGSDGRRGSLSIKSVSLWV